MCRLGLVLLLLAACSGSSDGPSGRGGEREGAPAPAEPVTVVEVAEVGRGSVADVLSTSSVVESELEADLVPATAGVVVEVRAEVGDRVRRGDVLAVLDNVALDASAERARAEVSRLEAEVERMIALHGRGAVSDQELAEARYQLQGARTSLNEAARSHGQTRLAAPFDGVVAKRGLRLGEYVSGGVTAFRVVDPSRLRVVVSLPERELSRVAPGQPVRLASAYDPALGAQGTVARVAPVVDPQTGTFEVTIGVADGQGALRPGQFVSAGIEVDRHEEVVVVPRKAVVWQDGDPVVYRMIPEKPDEDGDTDEDAEEEAGGGLFARLFGNEPAEAAEEAEEEPEGPRFEAERVAVELGLVDAERAEVVSGVQPGDRVIVVGQSNLRDGARVRTPGARKAEGEAATAAGEEG